jgi:hypothetical protein
MLTQQISQVSSACSMQAGDFTHATRGTGAENRSTAPVQRYVCAISLPTLQAPVPAVRGTQHEREDGGVRTACTQFMFGHACVSYEPKLQAQHKGGAGHGQLWQEHQRLPVLRHRFYPVARRRRVVFSNARSSRAAEVGFTMNYKLARGRGRMRASAFSPLSAALPHSLPPLLSHAQVVRKVESEGTQSEQKILTEIRIVDSEGARVIPPTTTRSKMCNTSNTPGRHLTALTIINRLNGFSLIKSFCLSHIVKGVQATGTSKSSVSGEALKTRAVEKSTPGSVSSDD